MKITVFTPTYNRGHILERAYKSLLNQTCKNFEWVVVDDGSTDNTRVLIDNWKKEADFTIVYIYQENKGRFAAFNNGKQYFNGELMAPLDSDDIFKDNCVQRLVETWESLGKKKKTTSGILAYMETPSGEILGTEFPKSIEYAELYLLPDKYKVKGDKLQVVRSDLIKRFEYKVYEGEKFGGDNILYFKINEIFPEYLLKEKLAIREYLPDSITNNLLKYHLQSKRGMRDHYYDCLVHEHYNYLRIIKHVIGYIAYSKLINVNTIEIVKQSPKKALTFIMFPAGYVYFVRLEKLEKTINEENINN